MNRRQKILVILFLLPLFVHMSPAEEEHASNLKDLLGKTINFIVLFGGLTYLLYKPLRSFLEKRAKDIALSLKEAGESRKEAEKRLEETGTRLAGLENEIERFRKEAGAEGLREKERIIRLAQQEAERIKSFARQEIGMLVQAEIRNLKEYTAELATALAEETLKKRLSPEDQSLLINKSIERLDGLYEKSNSRKKIHSRPN